MTVLPPSPGTVLPRAGVLAVLAALLGGLLAGALAALAPAPAFACSCADATLRQQAQAVDVVLRGTVVEQTRGSQPAGRATYVLEVDRVWKGTVAEGRVEVSSSADEASCGLGRLPEDRPVLLLAREPQGAGDGSLVAGLCDGTTVATSSVVAEVDRLLGEGTPVEPEPDPATEVTGTVVGDEGAPDVVRLAAPGAAVALAGLLGLLVARRRA